MLQRKLVLTFRSGLILSIILAFLSLALSALMLRCNISFGALTYGYLADTVRMVHTGNLNNFDPDRLAQATRFPFADPLSSRTMNACDNIALALPLLLRIDPIICALLVNIFPIVLSIVLFYSTCSLLFRPTVALSASAVFAFNRLCIANNAILAPEPLFVFAILAATFFLLRRYVNYNHPSVRIAILLGALITLPVYIRYIGIVFTMVSILYVIGETFARRRTNGIFREAFALMATSATLVALLMAHNYAASGVLSGHPMGIVPAYGFPQALFRMLVDTCVDSKLPLPVFLVPPALEVIPFLISASFLLFLLLASVRNRTIRLFAWFTVAYEIAFAVAESITRIDIISERFIYPVLPFMVIGIFCLVREACTLFASQRLAKMFSLCFILICAGSILLSVPLIVRGGQGDFNYSPQTVRAAMATLSPNENVFVNRYGAQLDIYRQDVHSHMLPFRDNSNANYNDAYGIHPLSRNEFIREMKIFSIRKMVFCSGRTGNDDGYIYNDGYGPFMKDIFYGHDPLVESVQSLPDGRIITLHNDYN